MHQHFWWMASGAAFLLIAIFAATPFYQLLKWSEFTLSGQFFHSAYLQNALRFTLYQSLLSASLSMLLAIPIASAFNRHRFFGKESLLKLSLLTFCLPVVLAAFAIIRSYGKQGYLAQFLSSLGWELPPIYGLPGIVLTHVFFNLPLATLILYRQLQSIPANHWRIVAQLNLQGWQLWTLIEWPRVKRVIPATFALITGLCFTSFAIVLAMGGGPKATTLEVAIYQAITVDFDLSNAASLALVQLSCCALILFIDQSFTQTASVDQETVGEIQRFDQFSRKQKIIDTFLLLFYAVFLIAPLLNLFIQALQFPLPSAWGVIISATKLSWIIALCAGSLAITLAFGLLLGTRHLYCRLGKTSWAKTLEMPAYSILLYPSLVLATGLFLLARPWLGEPWLAPSLVIIINALTVLPFAIRLLHAPFYQIAQQHDKLSHSLDITGLKRLRLLEWPLIRSDLAYALSVCATISLGDMGAVALFGSQSFTTLPLLLYQSLGSYRFGDAHWIALILLSQCLICYFSIRYFLAGKNHASRR